MISLLGSLGCRCRLISLHDFPFGLLLAALSSSLCPGNAIWGLCRRYFFLSHLPPARSAEEISQPRCLGVLTDSERKKTEDFESEADWIVLCARPGDLCKLHLVTLCCDGIPVEPSAVQIIFYERPAQRLFISQRNAFLDDFRPNSSLSTLDSALPLLAAIATDPQVSVKAMGLIGFICRLCTFLSSVAQFLCTPLMVFNSSMGGRSALLTQVEVRLKMQNKWSVWFKSIELREHLLLSFGILLSLFDTMIGCGLCYFLNSGKLLSCFTGLHRWAYGKGLVNLVDWLMGAPADFKLNHELTSFAGSFFLSMFSMWDVMFSLPDRVALEILEMWICGLCAVMGGSFLLTILMDILAIMSFPLFVAYSGTCLCWKTALRSLYTLSLLFQGWKYNVLRSRVDHHNFSLDELLVGVILLSIVVFLLPSLFMFYICFAAAWLLVVALHYTLGLLVMLCNHQPLCLLFLILLEPFAWHHGTVLVMEQSDQAKKSPHAWICLRWRSARAMDTLEPLKVSLGKYFHGLAGLGRLLASGTMLPIRCPITCNLSLPQAQSLPQDMERCQGQSLLVKDVQDGKSKAL